MLRRMPFVVAVAGLFLVVAWPSAAVGQGDWRWPLDGAHRVVRGFDPPQSPYGPGHRGVDLAGTVGSVVRAAGGGVVGYAGLLAGRGVVTVVHDDGLRTTYEPVQASVHRGEHVAPGEALGTLAPGHPGCPVAACLHWGLLRGQSYLDPLSLLGLGRVRLLPLRGQPVRPSLSQAPGDHTSQLGPARAPLSPTPVIPVATLGIARLERRRVRARWLR